MLYGQKAFKLCPSSQACLRLRVPNWFWKTQLTSISCLGRGGPGYYANCVFPTLCWCVEKYRMLTVTAWYSVAPAFCNLEDVFWPDVGLPPLVFVGPQTDIDGLQMCLPAASTWEKSRLRFADEGPPHIHAFLSKPAISVGGFCFWCCHRWTHCESL